MSLIHQSTPISTQIKDEEKIFKEIRINIEKTNLNGYSSHSVVSQDESDSCHSSVNEIDGHCEDDSYLNEEEGDFDVIRDVKVIVETDSDGNESQKETTCPIQGQKLRKNARTIVCRGCPKQLHTLDGYRLLRTTLYRVTDLPRIIKELRMMENETEEQVRQEEEKIRKCPECPEVFVSKRDLDCHWSKHNRDVEPKPGDCFFKMSNSLKNRLIRCKYCTFVDFRGKIRKHTILHEMTVKEKANDVKPRLLKFRDLLNKPPVRKPPICFQCHKRFDSLKNLICHFKLKHQLNCRQCSVKFVSFCQLLCHVKRHNLPKILWNCQSGLYQCSVCPRIIDNPKVMAHHVRRHRQGVIARRVLPKCDVCGFSSASLGSHIKIHETKNFKSHEHDVNNQNYVTKMAVSERQVDSDSQVKIVTNRNHDTGNVDISNHATVQSDSDHDSDYRVGIEARNKSTVERKFYTKYYDKRTHLFRCDRCPRTTIIKREFQSHMRGHKSKNPNFNECPKCSYRCRTRHMTNHLKLHEKFEKSLFVAPSKSPPPKPLPPPERLPPSEPLPPPTPPTRPTASSLTKGRGKKRKRDAESPVAVDVALDRYFDRSSKAYKCTECPLTCVKLIYFEQHMRRHKKPDNPEFVQCRQCTFWCHPRNMNRHALVHQRQVSRPKTIEDMLLDDGFYHCPDCPRATQQLQTFKRHLYGHETDEPGLVQCEYCTYKAKRGNITTHTKLHTNAVRDQSDPLRKCQYCGMKCRASEMTAHIKGHFKFGEELTVTVTNENQSSIDDAIMDESDRVGIIDEMQSFYDVYDQLYKCSECPRISRDALVFANHWRGHCHTESDRNLKQCRYCSFRANPNHLSDHMKLHEQLQASNSPPILDYYGTCQPPPRPILPITQKVKEKEKRQTDGENIVEIVDLSDDDDDLFMVTSTTFVCSTCQFESPTHEGLQIHKCCNRNKLFSCEVCTFQTKYAKCLTRHMIVHQ